MSIRRSLLFLILFMASCARPNNEVAEFMVANRISVDETEVILTLSDNGCPTCNRHFVGLIKEEMDMKGVAVVISATGTRFDLSALIDNKEDGIFWDDGSFEKIVEIKNSGAVFVDHGRIDTIVSIRPKDLERSLEYVRRRIAN